MSILSESSRSSSIHSLFDTTEAEDNVSYEVKFSINIVLNNFFISPDIKGNLLIYRKNILIIYIFFNQIQELEFPTSFNSSERSYIHRLCRMNGLNSVSKGFCFYFIILNIKN
jgi:hypothetical protein